MVLRMPCPPPFSSPGRGLLAPVFLLVGLVSFFTAPCAADTCWSWTTQYPHEVTAPYEGFPSKVAAHGSYLYAARSKEVVVLDATDPDSSVEVDRWTLGGLVKDMTVVDDCLVVFRSEDPGTAAVTLEFYSLLDPAHPVFASNVPFAASSYELAGANGILYARNGPEIRLFDISDPYTPAPLGTIPENGTDLTADVGRLYFAVSNLVYLYDTSTPGSPSLLGWWTAPSNILDLDARGETVHVVYGNSLVILDFTQPLIPQVIGELTQPAGDPRILFDIMRVGDLAYVRRSLDTYTKDLLAVDVSDPASLVPLWVCPLDLVYSITAGPDFVAIGANDYDYSNPRLDLVCFDTAAVRPSFANPGPGAELTYLNKTAVVGDVAWWGAGPRLTAVDLASMPNTTEVGSISCSGSAQALAGQAGLLYVGLANTNWGLQVYDVSDPGNAVRVGHVEEWMSPRAMLIGNGVLYVADGNSGLVVISLADPQQPTFVRRIALPGTTCDLALEGNLLSIAAGLDGLLLADCSDPENPTVVGRTPPGMRCYGVAVDGQYAYSRYFDLSVVDLSNPASPTIVTQVPVELGSGITPEGGRILFHGGLLYLASHNDGLQMIDVSDPAQPLSLTTATIASYVETVSVYGDHLLLVGSAAAAGATATPYEGLIGFPVQCPPGVGVPDGSPARRTLRLTVLPNPFNPTTTVTFSGRSGAASRVQVFDARGRLIDSIFDGVQTDVEQSIPWSPVRQASGVYFLRFESGGEVVTKKVTLLK